MKVQGLFKNFLLWFAIGIIIAIVLQAINSPLSLLFYNHHNIFFNLIFNLILIFILSYINIYIHEFGHALAGWLVGFPIKKITIGLGKNIWKYKIKATSTSIVINYGLQGGLTNLGDVSRNFLRLKFFIFVSGGILLQTLMVWLTIQITRNGLFVNSFFDWLSNLFIYTNMFMIIGNLLPYQTKAFGIPQPTDGLYLLTVFFLS